MIQLSEAQTKADKLTDIFINHPEQIMVAAHRAVHTHYPENSLGALQEAIRLGIDIVELDIRQTKDHVLVIMHDDKVDRTTNGKGNLVDFTYQQLMELRLVQNGKPTDEKVPTLEQVLKMAKGKILVDIDFKLGDEDALKRTYKTIEETQITNQVLFFLYQYKNTPSVHAINPDVKIMPRAYKQDDVNKILDMKIAKVIHIDEKFYTDSLMKKIADQHIRIWSNSLGTYDDLELASHFGFKALLTRTKYVNVIQTNLPEEWLKYLKQTGHHQL
ncbi:glycerophosphodiester phosphodiesterase family protein [Mucilaginibacter aquaedulcis]|uniref:glycerophosphodiester phosphodiesterase family protein n=1 Tax=Mucilaginibacter aquaedulcis TaxID=1187081 RepID=UPI0025B42A9C|nr:glycerophosphodiester phosphodiesterase family protein [Mucilaginibacter aquaedulcis]MDN3546729.1 glycerophosphodiester phosphodiesterase family protein [Mucilaginibacter aquaedulcis]